MRQRKPPVWETLASVWLHLCIGIALVLGEHCSMGTDSLFEPLPVMQVQMASLPPQSRSLPDRASRTSDPRSGSQTQSDNQHGPRETSDMMLHRDEQPDPEPDTEPPEENEVEGDAVAQTDDPHTPQASDEEKDPTAPIGVQDRARTSPEGAEGDQPSIIGIGQADPQLARYILACRDAVLPHWTPLPATVAAHPEYEVVIQVPVAADGALGTPKVVSGSGDDSFDRTALMAVIKTRKLPPPPPTWSQSAARGVQFVLPAKDKL